MQRFQPGQVIAALVQTGSIGETQYTNLPIEQERLKTDADTNPQYINPRPPEPFSVRCPPKDPPLDFL